MRYTAQVARRLWEHRWGIAIASVAAAAVVLTLLVRSKELLPGEVAVAGWLRDHDGWIGRVLARGLDIGFDQEVALTLLAVLVPAVWWAWGRYASVTFAAVVALAIPMWLVDLAYRPRPTEDLVWSEALRGGYPSGHVLYAVLVLGMLAFLASRHMPSTWRRPALTSGLIAVIVATGPARVIELEHWPADVLGGYLIALGLLLGAVWLHPRLLPWLGRPSPWMHSALTGP